MKNQSDKTFVSFLICISLLAVSLFSGKAHSGIVVIDDSGQQLILEQPVKRVISLSPHLTELMYFIGAGEMLIARDSASDYPEASQSLSSIGDVSLLNIEAIIALNPDLILAWQSGNSQKGLKQLSKRGIPIYYSEPSSPDGIYLNMINLSRLTGLDPLENKSVANFKTRLVEQNIKRAAGTPLTVFYQVWHQPLMTLNGEHLVSKLISDCGGINIFDDAEILAPQVNIESVILKNPQLIVSGSDEKTLSDFWNEKPEIEAVKRRQLVSIDPDLLVRPGPRILEGKKQLCKAIEQASGK